MTRWLLSLTLLTVVNADGDMGVHFTRSPVSVRAPPGDEAALVCGVNAPGGQIAWRRRRPTGWVDVESGGGCTVTQRAVTSTLTVQLADESVVGEYRCVAYFGPMAIASVAARLDLATLGPIDRLATRERLITVPPHNTLTLHCAPPPSAPPAVLAYWRVRNDKETSGTTDEPTPVKAGALFVGDSAVEDSGRYRCSATNELSGQTEILPDHLLLEVRSDAGGSAPRFLEPPNLVGNNITADGLPEIWGTAGKALVVACGAVSEPAPNITWQRTEPSERVIAASSGSVHVEPETQFLSFTLLKVQDEGTYTCVATNRLGSVRRSFVVVARRAARWLGPATAAPASEGGTARVTCARPDGQPPPEITWLLNAKPVDNDPAIHVNGEELIIERVEKYHSGSIQCFVSNELGSHYSSVVLSVIPKQISGVDLQEPGALATPGAADTNGVHQPGGRHRNGKKPHKRKPILVPPSKPNVTRLSDESVMVRWSVPENTGERIQFFKVQYKDMPPHGLGRSIRWETRDQDIPPHIRSYEVDNLIPDHYYRFRIAAAYMNNDNKLGETTARFHLQRGGTAHGPPAPALTFADPVNDTMIRIHWTFANNGTPVEGFYVYYRAASSAGDYVKTTVDGQKARTLLIQYLQPDTPYEIKLQSFTQVAPSEFSSIVVARTGRSVVGRDVTSTTEREVGELPQGVAGPYTVAGAAGGAAAVIGVLVTILLLCRRRRAETKEKPPAADEHQTTNGYLTSKVPMTITTNPLHSEGSDVSVEMSYLAAHNNNCNTRSSAHEDTDEVPPSPVSPHRGSLSRSGLSMSGSIVASVPNNYV